MAVGGEPRVKAWTAAVAEARRRTGFVLPDGVAQHAGQLGRLVSQWAVAEVAPGRLLPWLAVAFGFGIVVYFTADHEPAWWAALGAGLAATVIAVLARGHAVAFPLTLGVAAMAVGFATATLQAARLTHPVLQYPISSASVSGFVEVREERERSDRVTVLVQHIESPRLSEAPARVRVAVRKDTAPPVGSFVAFKAHLSPPLQPLRPGGYDFARDMYFMRIGASGYALGKIRIEAPPAQPGLWLRYARRP